ncbi:MAG: NAD(P)-binding domain-containing protein [Anditalea sp.]
MHKDILIIGAGQCGLAAGRFLQKKNRDFLILEKNKQVGENWRKRFGSLQLFTPAGYNSLPDLPMALSPKARPHKNQIADYFDRYVNHFDLPVSVNEVVNSVTKEGDFFKVKTSLDEITAEKVIIASGFCEKPYFPDWSANLNIPYIHSNEYNTPTSIKGKKVLVVGSGNSAAQIAAELSKYFEVHWSTNKNLKFSPLYMFGKNVLWFADKFGKLNKPMSEKKMKRGEAIYLYSNLKKLLKKTKRKKEVIGASDNEITFEGGEDECYDFILFATGFQPNYDFIRLPEFEDDLDQLRKQKGVSQVPGLYFLGIPHQRSRSSQLIYGSKKDAYFIVEQITQ